jgi:Legionella pneumophila major outer membrane protein precursor
MLDLQFGRYLKVFHRLELKPFFGLRSAWIQQHGHVAYEGGMFLMGILQPGISLNGTDYIEMKNNYWGMGPRVGIIPRLILGKGFGLNAETAISGLYGFFTIRQEESYLQTTRFSYHQHLNRFRWVGDLSAGIQWKAFFDQERYALTFKADWEYHIFFHQFQLRKDDFDLVPNNRDLSMQGVTISACFDF